MSGVIRPWLNNMAFDDPVERQQAALLQFMLLGMIVVGLLLLPITATVEGSGIIGLLINIAVVLIEVAALVVLRRGSFVPAVTIATVGLVLVLSGSIIRFGLAQGGNALLSFTVPITMAGLLAGRRGLLLNIGLSVAALVLAATIERLALFPLLPGAIRSEMTASLIITPIMIFVVLGLLLDRFSNSLRSSLTAALSREHELEQLRALLESTVAERTSSLSDALRLVEQRESRLARTLEDLQDSRAQVQEMSAPIIPVLPGVLVVPLVGALDSARAAAMSENALAAVEQQRARYVILDITGVPVVDTQVARVIMQTADALRLLGARVLLVGIRPEVAQTIVTLGVDFSTLETYANLQEAVGVLARLGNSRSSAALLKH